MTDAPDDIRGVDPEELERRRVAAQETIAKAKAKWDLMVEARKPLGPNATVADLHAGLRARVATSIFGSTFRVRQEMLMLPCFSGIPPLSDRVVAALITFWNRRAQAMEMANMGAANDPQE